MPNYSDTTHALLNAAADETTTRLLKLLDDITKLNPGITARELVEELYGRPTFAAPALTIREMVVAMARHGLS